MEEGTTLKAIKSRPKHSKDVPESLSTISGALLCDKTNFGTCRKKCFFFIKNSSKSLLFFSGNFCFLGQNFEMISKKHFFRDDPKTYQEILQGHQKDV